jgi:hypothetical protein
MLTSCSGLGSENAFADVKRAIAHAVFAALPPPTS